MRFVVLAIVVTILSSALFGWSVDSGRTEMKTDLMAMFPDYEEADQLDEIGRDFGNVDPFMILVRGDDLLTPDVYGELADIMDDVTADDDVDGVLMEPKSEAVVTVPHLVAAFKLMETGEYPTPDAVDSYIRSYDSGDAIRGDIRDFIQSPMVSQFYKDMLIPMFPKAYDPHSDEPLRQMALYVMLNKSMSEDERETAGLAIVDMSKGHEDTVEMYCYGESILSASYMEAEMEMEEYMGAAFMLLLVIMYFNYRRGSDVLLSCLALLMGLMWTFGVIGLLGWDIDFITFMIPMLILGLGIDFSFHIIMGYRERLGEGSLKDWDGRIRKASQVTVVGVGSALLLATATTAFGFASNASSAIPLITRFGILTALSIVFCCVANLTFVLGMRQWLDHRSVGKGKADRLRPIKLEAGYASKDGLLSLGRKTLKEPVPVLAVLVMLALPGFLMTEDLRGSYDPTDELMENQEITVAFNHFNHDFDLGTEFYAIRVDGDVADPALWSDVYEAVDRMADDDYVIVNDGKARVEWLGAMMSDLAAYSPNAAVMLATVDGDMDGRVDDNVSRADLESFLDVLYAQQTTRYLIHRGDDGYDGLLVRVYTRTQIGFYGFEARDELVDDLSCVDAEVTVTGLPLIWAIGLTEMRDSMNQATVLTIVFSFILLVAIFSIRSKEPLLGAMMAVPPVLVVGWTLGTMALLGLKLNMMTAFVGALTIGLGIDYPIHIGSRWYQERQAGRDRDTCYDLSIRSTGKEVFYSSVTTLVAFLVFAMMPMPIMAQFGVTMAIGIVFSLVGAVVVLPLMLVLWHRT